MTKKITFDPNDFNRVVLTDTLPYECPFIFSNTHFYEKLSKNFPKSKINNKFISDLILAKRNYTIPYTYNSSQTNGKKRPISVTHPWAQIETTLFYENHYPMMLDRCSISPFTLRAPIRVASAFYEKTSMQIEDELRSDKVESKTYPNQSFSSSFFVYSPFGRIFEFYQSRDFLELEKRYSILAKIDISKCFYNIYTHSISWAVKNKQFAKDNIGTYSFEAEFDSLMQKSNHSETNGIVVGPESSRIFAEIILQDIDRKVESELNKEGIKHVKNYDVRRYIDDYFIFANKNEVKDKVISAYEKLLEEYKLYPNHSKAETLTRPFVTQKSSANIDLISVVDNFFDDIFIQNEPKISIKTTNLTTSTSKGLNRKNILRWSATKIINIYKSVVANHNLEYGDTSGFFLGMVRQRILNFTHQATCDLNKINETESATKFIELVVGVIFFTLLTDPRSRTVDICAQTLIVLRDHFGLYHQPLPQALEESIQLEFANGFLSLDDESLAVKNSVEFSSLLVVIGHTCPNWNVDQSTLLEFWKGLERKGQTLMETVQFPYFEAICLLYFSENKIDYNHLRTAITTHLKEHLRVPNFQCRADLTMAFLDFLSCPFISKTDKISLTKQAWISLHGQECKDDSKIQNIIKHAMESYWFTNWSQDIDIRFSLFKKELRTSY